MLLTVVKLSAVVALVLAALPLAGLIFNRPPLFDPPGPARRISAYLTTNVAETRDDSTFPELRPRQFDIPAGQLYERTARAIERLNWEFTERDAASGRLRAVVTTPVWKFRDDVAVEARALPGNRSTLHVRSASRVGRGDLAANTRHVLDLYAALDSLPAP
jgi:uncharacterized protein (DUF1499 family)